MSEQPTQQPIVTEQQVLTLSSIQHIDNGKVALNFNQLLRAITRDVIDRPGDKSKRKVMLTIELSPDLDADTATLDTIKTTFKMKTALPVLQSAEYPMLADSEGRQHFQPTAPFQPRQQALPYPNALQPGEQVDRSTGEVAQTPDDDLESDTTQI